MEQEENTVATLPQSFIIRFWIDESPVAPAPWRGQITHVPSGARQYLQQLDDIRSFIVPYLTALGVAPDAVKSQWRWWPFGSR